MKNPLVYLYVRLSVRLVRQTSSPEPNGKENKGVMLFFIASFERRKKLFSQPGG